MTRKSMLPVFAAAMVLAGCMTRQMKSTPFYEGHEREKGTSVDFFFIPVWR